MTGRLLIIDDEPVIGRLLCKAAEKIGFLTKATCVLSEFFAHLAQWQPSHLAIDLSMPEMSGLQVLARLSASGCTAPIIITSGCDIGRLDAALDRARDLGLTTAGALPKPSTLRQLHALLTDELVERDAVLVPAGR